MLGRKAGLLEGAVAGSWSLGIVKQSQCEGCYWLWRDRLRGCEGGDCGGKCLWRKARQPWKKGDTAGSRVGVGAITIAPISLHTPASGSWTIERLAHQTPDALIYRVGPQSWGGGVLYVPDALNNREEPQARDLPKCLNRWSYGERQAKEAFWLPATRGSKKDTDRAITPVTETVCVPGHLALPGCLQARKLHHLHDQLSLGQSCHRQKQQQQQQKPCLCVQDGFGPVRLFATL